MKFILYLLALLFKSRAMVLEVRFLSLFKGLRQTNHKRRIILCHRVYGFHRDADYDFVASVLKAPVDGLAATHHGARFLSPWDSIPRPKRAPARCILSFGRGNSYGHPHQDALKKHSAAGWRQIVSTAASKGVPRADREFE
jgi:hypothetical protein